MSDAVTAGRRLRDETPDPHPDRVGELLARVDLSGYGDRSVTDLSGDEAQRVAVARTLLVDPEVLLLDEPTASLDADAQAKVEALLTDLLADAGRTVVLVTHDEAQAVRIADRVARFVDEQAREQGAPREVIA